VWVPSWENRDLQELLWPPSVGKAQQTAVLLCIDDSPDLLECEKAFLETFGYTVLTAPSGSKALELASTHAIDVAIVDYFMPEMNGHEFAVEMRRLRPQAPIIMLSGTVDVPKQALKLVDAFIPKDCLSSELLPVIARLHDPCGGGPESSFLGKPSQSRPDRFTIGLR
jgi:CheY-like chemotaxis protein